MVLVKILGALDLLTAVVLLSFVFGISPWIQLILFCAGLLFIKGLFIFTGEPLSLIDLSASATLILSVWFSPWLWLLWSLSFLLLSKGVVSFL